MSSHLQLLLVGNLVFFMRDRGIDVQGNFTGMCIHSLNLEKISSLAKMVLA